MNNLFIFLSLICRLGIESELAARSTLNCVAFIFLWMEENENKLSHLQIRPPRTLRYKVSKNVFIYFFKCYEPSSRNLRVWRPTGKKIFNININSSFISFHSIFFLNSFKCPMVILKIAFRLAVFFCNAASVVDVARPRFFNKPMTHFSYYYHFFFGFKIFASLNVTIIASLILYAMQDSYNHPANHRNQLPQRSVN
jgi:hypothetical protein